jgi:DnaJ-class molecular chaperone
MNLQEHEVICSKCDGEALITIDDNVKEVCDKCGGKGKLDWISNAMSRKVTLVTPGVYTQEVDLSPFIPSSDITFHSEGKEMIKLTKDSFYVKGKKIADDKKLYDAFVDFLRGIGTYV